MDCMNKSQKAELLKSLEQVYSGASYAFLINTKSVSVAQISLFRRALKGKAVVKVVKNTINKLAFGSKFASMSSKLEGQVTTILTSDPVEVAKCLVEFSKFAGIQIIGFGDQSGFYGKEKVEVLSKIPSLQALRGQILGSLTAVPSKILSCLSGVQKNTLLLVKNKYSE
jgi:ribosomal protein L10